VTLFVNLRGNAYGAVCSPYVLEGDALTPAAEMTSVLWNAVPILARGKDVFLVTHGFNVSYENGLRSLAQLEARLALRPNELFLGVLWPGDWIVPAVNYPVEDGIASRSGQLLGQFCNQWLKQAASLSMVSHSLGARVILEAIKASARRVRRACITAGAVNDGCLAEEYAAAASNCDAFTTLSSMMDQVLSIAYPPGDLAADVLDPDHPPFQAALGRHGPRPPAPTSLRPYQIPDVADYNHSDYYPPAVAGELDPTPGAKWPLPAAFIASVLRDRTPAWPAG
jgi:hypothetical protein